MYNIWPKKAKEVTKLRTYSQDLVLIPARIRVCWLRVSEILHEEVKIRQWNEGWTCLFLRVKKVKIKIYIDFIIVLYFVSFKECDA